ncbi:MAG: pyruvate kinase [Patescibacteria group bacterium]
MTSILQLKNSFRFSNNNVYIVATISKNSYAPEKIEEILLAGADVLRYNFSHGDPAAMVERFRGAREVIGKLGLDKKVKLLADLPGAKIRLGDFPRREHPVQEGEYFIFKSASESPNPAEFVPINFPDIGTLVEINQMITLGDGEIAFEVVEIISPDSFRARAQNTWHIPALKGVNLTRGIDELDHFTEATLAHLHNLNMIKPDWIAFSFVNGVQYLKRAKQLLQPYLHDLWQPQIVAKIETPKGVENINEIAQEADIILVARGDLGLLCPIEELGINQKKIIKAAKAAGKRVVVSTQILDSLMDWYIPKRSDILDLTNIVFDGADGIMLAKETGISHTPGRSVEMAKRIIDTVEREKVFLI